MLKNTVFVDFQGLFFNSLLTSEKQIQKQQRGECQAVFPLSVCKDPSNPIFPLAMDIDFIIHFRSTNI